MIKHWQKLRRRHEPDTSLGAFLPQQFRQQVERPFKKLGHLSELWQQRVPASILPHTRLLSLRSGVLKVAVDDPAHLYQLDRLLRGGLERELVLAQRMGTLRKVKLELARSDHA